MTKSLTVTVREDRERKSVSTIGVDVTPTECPICHTGIRPVDRDLTWLIKGETYAEQVLQCPNEDCKHFQNLPRFLRDLCAGGGSRSGRPSFSCWPGL